MHIGIIAEVQEYCLFTSSILTIAYIIFMWNVKPSAFKTKRSIVGYITYLEISHLLKKSPLYHTSATFYLLVLQGDPILETRDPLIPDRSNFQTMSPGNLRKLNYSIIVDKIIWKIQLHCKRLRFTSPLQSLIKLGYLFPDP